MTSMLVGEETGVTKAAEQAIATVIAKAWGETCKAWAASMATGAIKTAVAALEMNKPTSAVTKNTTPSIKLGANGPKALTRPLELIYKQKLKGAITQRP